MTIELHFPESYRGLFARTQDRYAPLIREALQRLEDMDVPTDLRPFLAYQMWENPQPSFVLFPFMFLATAEVSGGIRRSHEEYLSMILLFCALCAVADDTIDRSPKRSGRATFAGRYGDTSAMAMASALVTMVMHASRHDTRLADAAYDFFLPFFGLELWEVSNVYPEPDLFTDWLDHRYDQAIVATAFTLNAALILNEQPLWPQTAIAALSRVAQDVDDVVNILEFRARDGENDDLQSGVVTKPLVLTIARSSAVGAEVDGFWRAYKELAQRRLSIEHLAEERARLTARLWPQYVSIRARLVDTGVPETIRSSLVDMKLAVNMSPLYLRALMRDFASSFLDRLRRCEQVRVDASVVLSV